MLDNYFIVREAGEKYYLTYKIGNYEIIIDSGTDAWELIQRAIDKINEIGTISKYIEVHGTIKLNGRPIKLRGSGITIKGSEVEEE
jgi:hypothetical protein